MEYIRNITDEQLATLIASELSKSIFISIMKDNFDISEEWAEDFYHLVDSYINTYSEKHVLKTIVSLEKKGG